MSTRYWHGIDEHGERSAGVLGPVNEMKPPVVAHEDVRDVLIRNSAAVNEQLDQDDIARSEQISDMEMIAAADCRLMLRALRIMERFLDRNTPRKLSELRTEIDLKYGAALRRTTEVAQAHEIHF
jgi:hypothetical protein